MAKKDNSIIWIILAIGLIGILWYGGQNGWFKGIFSINMPETPFTPNPDHVPNEYVSYYVTLNLNPSNMCVGHSSTGTIDSNIPNGVCSIFSQLSGVWSLYRNVNLNANGNYSETQRVDTAGVANFRAVCCDASGNCKISSQVSLTVRVCDNDGDGIPDDIDPDDDNDGWTDITEIGAGTNPLDPASHPSSGETGCSATCIALGYLSGRGPFESGGLCTYPEVIEYMVGESGLICCCTPVTGGGDFGGYASCTAFQIAEGKEFYVTGAGLNNIDECEAYAQGYCSQFGSAEPHVFGGVPPGYVTMLDFANPDCCIFNCNWSWN